MAARIGAVATEAELNRFVAHFAKELSEQNAAIFAGAGLSVASGFVNWKDLMRSIAKELRLDVDREENLIAVAQYHENERAGNRARLNQLLINEFTEGHEINDNPEETATTGGIEYTYHRVR